MIMGFADSMDILTLSLGIAYGWTESISSVVASRLANLAVVTIAAGNEGNEASLKISFQGNL